ncbi:hypothetical protein C9374_001687 [Naegleria lovaniensis]|uniref:SHOCT domain-containing protein n=1 Tax=Naegleria lovaniensis TaxID=51637 RepID=A0AA88KL11_NAELO|nr:uncharacterized protein C9374_001687 [Naegleria lovaniensis]KAG2387355.1 hypothetical protein C9374_001687 [Naegleria lovaniensis]
MKLGALSNLVKQQKLQQAVKTFRQEEIEGSSSNENTTKSLLFDIGTFSLRAGLLSSNSITEPQIPDFHSWVYRYDFTHGFSRGLDENKRYFGFKSHESASFVPYPIFKQGGWLSNLNDFSHLVSEVVKNVDPSKLRSSTESLPFLMTGFEYLNGQKIALGKLTQVVFEELKSSKFAFQEQTKCGLVASGLTTATVINIGYGTNYSISYQDGQAQTHVENHGLNGNYLTDVFVKIMTDREQYVDTRSERIRVVKAKEGASFVSLDSENENVPAIDYQLPDGKTIHLENERFEAFESLFDPTRNIINPYKPIEEKFMSLQKMISTSAPSAPSSKKAMIENILLMGGVCCVENLQKRLFMELDKEFNDDTMNWNIKQPRDVNLAYKGLSMLASLSSFESCYITRQEYEESGEGVYVRRFPRIKVVQNEEVEEKRRIQEEIYERNEALKTKEEAEQEEEAKHQPPKESSASEPLSAGTTSTASTKTATAVEKQNPPQEKKPVALDFDAQMEQLKKLKELLDCGILTQEEFNEKKKKILGL